MTTIADLRAWLNTLGPESTVAIDDGGLTLVELDKGTEPTGAYLEVGGVPGRFLCSICRQPVEEFDGEDDTCAECVSVLALEENEAEGH